MIKELKPFTSAQLELWISYNLNITTCILEIYPHFHGLNYLVPLTKKQPDYEWIFRKCWERELCI